MGDNLPVPRSNRAPARRTHGAGKELAPVDQTKKDRKKKRKKGEDPEPTEAQLRAAAMVAEIRGETLEEEEPPFRVRDALAEHWRPWKYGITFAVMGAAIVLAKWLLDVFAGDSHAPQIATLVGLLAFGVPLAVRAVNRSLVSREWMLHAVVIWIGGASWLTTLAIRYHWTHVAFLILGQFVLGARHWRQVRIPIPDRELPVEEPPMPAAPEFHELWMENLAGQDGRVRGSYLTNFQVIEGRGFQYDVKLNPGKMTVSELRLLLPYIASGTNVPMSKLLIEDHPSGRPAEAQVKVIENSPLDGDVLYDGPRYKDGLMEIGPYGDVGEALWRLYEGDPTGKGGSMWPGVIIAASGGGKSRIIENICLNAMASGVTIPWFIDPQDGASSPPMQEFCDWYVNLAGAQDVLEAVKRIAFVRGIENAANKWTGFKPSKERPGILIFIDECHEIFRDESVADEWALLQRKMRKLGIALVLVSQYSGLATFGNSEPLRSSVMVGNAIVLYTASNTSGQLMAGLEVDPQDLPRIPGYGYTMRVGTFGRLAPFRNRLVVDADAEFKKVVGLVPELDELSRMAAGDVYKNRRTTLDEIRADQLETLEKIKRGEMTVEEAMAARQETATQAPSAKLPGQREDDEMDSLFALAEEMASWGPIDGDAVTGPASTPEATTVRDKVLDLVRSGVSAKADLIKQSDASESAVRGALDDLIEANLVQRVRHGHYGPVADMQPAA